MTWQLIFLVFALVFFLLATFSIPVPRVSLGWAGMVFITLFFMFSSGMFPVR